MLAYTRSAEASGSATSGNGYQRDVHVRNNSPDAASNNNVDARRELSRRARRRAGRLEEREGAGRPTTRSRRRNFDYDCQGTSTSNRTRTPTPSAGDRPAAAAESLAYTETPISDGWRIVMCDSWTWDDGPGALGGADRHPGRRDARDRPRARHRATARRSTAGARPRRPCAPPSATRRRPSARSRADDQAGLQADLRHRSRRTSP